MDEVTLPVLIETIGESEVIELGIDLLQIPGIVEIKHGQTHFGIRRNGRNVTCNVVGQCLGISGIEQFEAIDWQRIMAAKPGAWLP
ncbi:hypothetical protein AA0311_1087 [Asaia bogorensis NBRC 16594]|nr:hypothetical protein AA0311_1087 [Asaia bogorensis NBRC 16594]